ncbi:MAG: twin-arginine translocase subunit TatB [Rhizobiales bacterium]|nr:twin-arginine translocase subunit TatB [Hyphomicrobiales bacterium]
MFDFGIGSFELMMLAIVAIIVVGPKDLPKLLRTIGQFMTKIRGMAREFQGYLDEAARDTGLDDVKSDIGKMTNFDIKDTLDPATDKKPAASEGAAKPEFDPVVEGNKAAKATAEAVRAKDAEDAGKAKPARKTAKKTAKKPAKAKAKA